jgi:hypothetical protein
MKKLFGRKSKPTGIKAQDPTRVQKSEPVASPTEQQTPSLPTSQRLWNTAYDSLGSDDETAKLIRDYIKTLTSVLAIEGAANSNTDTSIDPMDPAERQRYMRKLVETGQVKIATTAKVTKKVLGDAVDFVLSAKGMIDLAIQNIPQAALPWAGVCIGLQVST